MSAVAWVLCLDIYPVPPHCKPEVREDNEIHNDYDFFRPVIRVQTSGWRIVSPEMRGDIDEKPIGAIIGRAIKTN